MKKIIQARDVYDLVGDTLKGEEQENLLLVTLNSANIVKSVHTLTIGDDVSTIISVKQVVRTAIINNAAGVIMVHNHPSGNPQPSMADTKETEKVRQGLNYMDIALLDHVIISDGCYYSFSDEQTVRI